MRKPIDKHFEYSHDGYVRCRHCGELVKDQGLAKVSHLPNCCAGQSASETSLQEGLRNGD